MISNEEESKNEEDELEFAELFAEFEMEHPSQQPLNDEDDNEDGTLTTIVGASKFITIKMQGKVGEDNVVVLIDGRATHNFIDAEFVGKKKLKSEIFSGFRVFNVNGQISLCDQVVKQVKISFGDYSVVDDFYVYSGGIPHAVLGVQWLYSLGKIYTKYTTLEFKLKSNGKMVVLKGMKDHYRQQ